MSTDNFSGLNWKEEIDTLLKFVSWDIRRTVHTQYRYVYTYLKIYPPRPLSMLNICWWCFIPRAEAK